VSARLPEYDARKVVARMSETTQSHGPSGAALASGPHGIETASGGENGKMRVITISREYGSGGGEIAARLANLLNWRLIDHEVVVEVARRLGVTVGDAARRDEQAEPMVEQLLRGFRAVDPTPLPLVGTNDAISWPETHDYVTALRETVLAAAYAGNVVIVGRGGQAILRDWRDALHARIVAPLPTRVAYVAGREGLDQQAAQRRIQKKDQDRQRYLRSIHDVRAEDPLLYDITLNTGIMDLDGCVDLIVMALEHKGRRLKTPAELLGPGAGLAVYRGQPEDLPTVTDPPSTLGAPEATAEAGG
jgi:cytidylate kinase